MNQIIHSANQGIIATNQGKGVSILAAFQLDGYQLDGYQLAARYLPVFSR
ncbi:MAG TPA: hypothetical protein PKH40_11695 [Treponemataceae bacterium]|nr:hypothetical protein [Treponemataceae bacterium]HQL31922.1 hypothetical protein [Treponemataceae bacterium]